MKRLIASAIALLLAVFAGVEYIKPKEDLFLYNWDTTTEQDGGGTFYWELQTVSEQEAENYYSSTIKQLRPAPDGGESCDGSAVFLSKEGDWQSCAVLPPVWKAEQAEDATDTDGASSSTANNKDRLLQYWKQCIMADGSTNCGTATEYATSTDASTGNAFDPATATGLTDWTITCADDALYYIIAPSDGEIVTSSYASEYGKSMTVKFTAYGDTGAQTWSMTIKNGLCWYCCRNKHPDNNMYTATGADLQGTKIVRGQVLMLAGQGCTIKFSKAD